VIPLAVPDLSGNESRYLQECIDTTFVSSVGPFVDRFEAMVAAAAGTEAAVAVSSGTTGLHAALTAVGVGHNDLVAMPSYTFIASANAVSHCGARPWLFDVEPATWCLDPAQLSATLAAETEMQDGRCVHKASGRRVAAVLPVYAFGLPADMDAITKIAREHGLPVVADAAAAIGAAHKGRAIGLTGADLTVFSFNGNKTVTAGGGGAIAGTDNRRLAALRHLTTTARIGPDYTHDQVGFNYRLTNLQAAVGCAQMERLDALVARKREVRAAYDAALAGRGGFSAFPSPDWAESACWISGVVAADAELADAARRHLAGTGFKALPFWKPMHLQPPYADCPTTAMPVTDELWYRIVPLPSSSALSAADQASVIDAIAGLAGQSPAIATGR
jgi:perosamine synthetase